MSDLDGAGCVASILMLVVLVVAIHSCKGALDEGICLERWRHQITAADTLRTIRGGCELPLSAKGKS